MDSDCVSSELGQPVYGGIREISLPGRLQRLTFDQRAAADLGLGDPVIEVLLGVGRRRGVTRLESSETTTHIVSDREAIVTVERSSPC